MRPSLLALFTVLLSACAGSPPPEDVRYLLRAEQSSAQRTAQQSIQVGLGRVMVPAYLDQPGIVLETAPGQVRAARHHLWAEPFDQGLRHYLRQAVSAEMGVDVGIDEREAKSWRYRLDVRFEEFHGTGDGTVRMAADYSWTEVATNTIVGRGRLSDVQQFSGDGYGAMVAAHEILLTRLAGVMAQGVEHEQLAGATDSMRTR
jgi:uncharacterized lipoprotein YmbA